MKKFCEIIVEEFSNPTEEDLLPIMKINAMRGSAGCNGSIESQHWEWERYPNAWAGQLTRERKNLPLYFKRLQIKKIGFDTTISVVLDR